MSKRILVVAIAVAALVFPAAAAAHGDGPGKKPKKPKTVELVFVGVYEGDGVVDVRHGNRHVRRAGLVGTAVTFDMSSARVHAPESDGVPGKSAGDLRAGDRVLVTARAPRGARTSQAAAAFTARMVVVLRRTPVEEPPPPPEEPPTIIS